MRLARAWPPGEHQEREQRLGVTAGQADVAIVGGARVEASEEIDLQADALGSGAGRHDGSVQ